MIRVAKVLIWKGRPHRHPTSHRLRTTADTAAVGGGTTTAEAMEGGITTTPAVHTIVRHIRRITLPAVAVQALCVFAL